MERNKLGQFLVGKEPFKLDEKFIIEKYGEGLSCESIGKLLGVSPQTIHRRLIKNKIELRDTSYKVGHAPVPGSEKGAFVKGQKSVAWKTGIRTCSGYKEIWVKELQRYVKESILIMESKIGRKLTDNECVHHINKNKLDNRLENLKLMTNSEHGYLHSKERYDNGTSKLYEINNKKSDL